MARSCLRVLALLSPAAAVKLPESWFDSLSFDVNHSMPDVEATQNLYLEKANPMRCKRAVDQPQRYSLCFASGGLNPKKPGDTDHYDDKAWKAYPLKEGLPEEHNSMSCKYCPTTGFWPQAERSMMIYCPHRLLAEWNTKHTNKKGPLMKRCADTGIDLFQDAVLYRGPYFEKSPESVKIITTYFADLDRKLMWPQDAASMVTGTFGASEASNSDFGSSFEEFHTADDKDRHANTQIHVEGDVEEVKSEEQKFDKKDNERLQGLLNQEDKRLQGLRGKDVDGLFAFQWDFNDVRFCSELCVPNPYKGQEGKCMSKDCGESDREAPGVGENPCEKKCRPSKTLTEKMQETGSKQAACRATEDDKYHAKITETMLKRMREGLNKAKETYKKCHVKHNSARSMSISKADARRRCCAGGTPHHAKGLVKCFLCRLLLA